MSAAKSEAEIEAAVAHAIYNALRRSHGASRIVRGEEEKHQYDNVLVIATGCGINLRVLARAAIKEQRRLA